MTALERELGLGAQVADMERIRRILCVEKLIIIGHSFGGFWASLYAAEFPERVEALILVAPADVLLIPQTGGGLFEAVRRRLPEEMQAEYAAYLRDYFDRDYRLSAGVSIWDTESAFYSVLWCAAKALPFRVLGLDGRLKAWQNEMR